MQQGYGPPPPQGYYGGPPTPPPKRMGAGTITLIVFGVLFGGCITCGAIGSAMKPKEGAAASTTPTSAPEPRAPAAPPAPKPKPPAMPVSAAQLFSDYQGNEVAADEKYKGRPLLVSGNVTDIKKDFMDNIVVHLRTSNQFMPIDAHVEDSEKAKAMQLTKGDVATLRCEGGGMVIGRPQLSDCTIE